MTQSSNSTAAESSHKRVELLKRTTRFPNLRAAGRELALQLQTYRARADSIVMGIALGVANNETRANYRCCPCRLA